MKNLWYKIIRLYVKWGLQAYFHTIKIYGKENIPKKGAVLFVANHRNGLLDAVLIGVSSGRIHYYLTRASAFKNPIARLLLRSIHMIPVYRVRDGIRSVHKNEEVFNYSFQVLNREETVLLFPEGNHGIHRKLRPLRKGFARIAFGFLERHDKELYIVPVGINYNNMFLKGSDVSIYYGKPILVNSYYNPGDLNSATKALTQKVSDSIKRWSTHIEDSGKYAEIERYLIRQGVDFLDPQKANNLIHTFDYGKVEPGDLEMPIKPPGLQQKLIAFLFRLNTLIPIILWHLIKPNIQDPALRATYLFGLSLGVIPIFYVLQAILLGFFINPLSGILYFLGSVGLLFMYKNSIQITNFTTKPS